MIMYGFSFQQAASIVKRDMPLLCPGNLVDYRLATDNCDVLAQSILPSDLNRYWKEYYVPTDKCKLEVELHLS